MCNNNTMCHYRARAQLDKVLQKSVVSHKSAKMSLKDLISSTKRTFNKCLDVVDRNFHFSRKVLANPNFQVGRRMFQN